MPKSPEKYLTRSKIKLCLPTVEIIKNLITNKYYYTFNNDCHKEKFELPIRPSLIGAYIFLEVLESGSF